MRERRNVPRETLGLVTVEHLTDAAIAVGIEPRALLALAQVEAGGLQGIYSGRPLIRLEVHHLWYATARDRRPALDERYHVGGPRPWEGHVWRPEPGGEWVPLHQWPLDQGQPLEWAALELADAISGIEAAVTSTSWGIGQILGRHYPALGWPSAYEWARSQHEPREQARALALYVEIEGLTALLEQRDWLEVARRYNGPGKAAEYAAKLAQAYEGLA